MSPKDVCCRAALVVVVFAEVPLRSGGFNDSALPLPLPSNSVKNLGRPRPAVKIKNRITAPALHARSRRKANIC